MVRFSNARSASSPAAVDGAERARRRADARRVDILRAAARVFRTRGFAAAGMREIAIAADLSPANLYHYFRGKDELLYFCQDRALDRLGAALKTARQSRGPIGERLHALARAHVLCLVDEIEGSAAHLDIDALPPRLRAAIVTKRDGYERGVRALIARGIRAGDLRHDDATVATRAFLGALNWTARWFNPDGAMSPDRLSRLVADFAVAGLGTRPRLTDAHHAAPPQDTDHETAGAHRAHRQPRADGSRVRSVQDAPRGVA